jgi:signal transduction histidine kinase
MHGRAALIGASLDVTSEPGQGTTVTVVVPAPTVVS